MPAGRGLQQIARAFIVPEQTMARLTALLDAGVRAVAINSANWAAT